MSEAPQLPQHISNDGREVWDWASRLSDQVHRQDEIRRTRSDLSRIGTRCGDCSHWMKSRQCPREQNIGGRRTGPSCEGLVCSDFALDHFAAKRRDELTEKLAALSQESPKT